MVPDALVDPTVTDADYLGAGPSMSIPASDTASEKAFSASTVER
jgi:hypothetical protein